MQLQKQLELSAQIGQQLLEENNRLKLQLQEQAATNSSSLSLSNSSSKLYRDKCLQLEQELEQQILLNQELKLKLENSSKQQEQQNMKTRKRLRHEEEEAGEEEPVGEEEVKEQQVEPAAVKEPAQTKDKASTNDTQLTSTITENNAQNEHIKWLESQLDSTIQQLNQVTNQRDLIEQKLFMEQQQQQHHQHDQQQQQQSPQTSNLSSDIELMIMTSSDNQQEHDPTVNFTENNNSLFSEVEDRRLKLQAKHKKALRALRQLSKQRQNLRQMVRLLKQQNSGSGVRGEEELQHQPSASASAFSLLPLSSSYLSIVQQLVEMMPFWPNKPAGIAAGQLLVEQILASAEQADWNDELSFAVNLLDNWKQKTGISTNQLNSSCEDDALSELVQHQLKNQQEKIYQLNKQLSRLNLVKLEMERQFNKQRAEWRRQHQQALSSSNRNVSHDGDDDAGDNDELGFSDASSSTANDNGFEESTSTETTTANDIKKPYSVSSEENNHTHNTEISHKSLTIHRLASNQTDLSNQPSPSENFVTRNSLNLPQSNTLKAVGSLSSDLDELESPHKQASALSSSPQPKQVFVGRDRVNQECQQQ